jgi:hypothetical protein
MECSIFEKYLKGNDCCSDIIPVEITKHLGECKNCQNYYQFAMILNSQKSVLEKAPEDILPAVENKIFESITLKKESLNRFKYLLKPSFNGLFEHIGLYNRFKYLLKPAFAGLFVLLLIVVSYTYLANKNIGYVENLSERFKLSQFENIKSGDMLYAGDNTTADIRLNSKNKLQIHQNTIVRVKGSRKIALSRGEISLASGDNELQIETPDGVLLARNSNTKITTIASVENGLIKTETTCIVFKGTLIIKHPLREIVLNQGQKAVLAGNDGITYPQQMTVAESKSEKSAAVKQKLFAAVESLCDCIHTFNYTPGKKADHLQLFGKEVNEKKFKVRVFWQEKGLNELGFGHPGEESKTCFIPLWRSDG